MSSENSTNTVTDSEQQANLQAAEIKKKRMRKRRWLLRGLLAIVVIVGIVWLAYYMLVARWYETTEDAYVNGNVVQVMPRIPGSVVRIAADDNDFVQKGQVLVTLDSSDVDVALEQAKAALGQAVRRVSGFYSAVKTSQAKVDVSKSALKRAKADYQRRKRLAASGAISGEVLAHARDALSSAQSSLVAAQSQLARARAQIQGTDIANHPDVKAAAAALRKAWLDDRHTVLRAPVSGYVAQRGVQLGQHVQPGTPLMAVVPLNKVWVDANFKETQLTEMRIGQPVTLTADVYGDDVTYHGRVEGLGIGTGSAFSLLPAQNATGNWIKIVQRLPVRIALSADELDRRPLRIGLSMDVKVDLHDQSGPMLAKKATQKPALETDVYRNDQGPVDAMIAKIIKTNAVASDDGKQPVTAAKNK